MRIINHALSFDYDRIQYGIVIIKIQFDWIKDSLNRWNIHPIWLAVGRYPRSACRMTFNNSQCIAAIYCIVQFINCGIINAISDYLNIVVTLHFDHVRFCRCADHKLPTCSCWFFSDLNWFELNANELFRMRMRTKLIGWKFIRTKENRSNAFISSRRGRRRRRQISDANRSWGILHFRIEAIALIDPRHDRHSQCRSHAPFSHQSYFHGRRRDNQSEDDHSDIIFVIKSEFLMWLAIKFNDISIEVTFGWHWWTIPN